MTQTYHFEMTREEVKYFLDNIEHEYLGKDNYEKSIKLIKRMREFLDKDEHELVTRDNQAT